MSFYIRPKFKVGQKIFSIKNDSICEIEIESIAITGASVSYLSKNLRYAENRSFESFQEAKDFLQNAIRIPFKVGDYCWVGDLTGVRRGLVKCTAFYYKENLKKPYNSQIHVDNILNSTSCFETAREAVMACLEQINLKE